MVYIVISVNSGWGMYLYGVNSGIARGNLVSGNVSGEKVYEFYPDDGNSNTKVVLSRITAEVSGVVRIGYVVSDLEGDSVRLRVEYSVNGVDWNRVVVG